MSKQSHVQAISRKNWLSRLTLLRFEFIASAESATWLMVWSGWIISVDYVMLLLQINNIYRAVLWQILLTYIAPSIEELFLLRVSCVISNFSFVAENFIEFKIISHSDSICWTSSITQDGNLWSAEFKSLDSKPVTLVGWWWDTRLVANWKVQLIPLIESDNVGLFNFHVQA